MATPAVIAAALQNIEYGHLRCNFDTIYTANTPDGERKITERLRILDSVFKSILLDYGSAQIPGPNQHNSESATTQPEDVVLAEREP